MTLNHGQFCPQGTFGNMWRHSGWSSLGEMEEVWLAPSGQRLGKLQNSPPFTGHFSTTGDYPAQTWAEQGLRRPAWGAMALPPPQGAGLLQGGQMCPWHRVLSSLETDKIQGLVHQWAFPISSNFWLFLGRWETGLETRKSLYTEFRLYCMIINVSR